MKSSGSILIVDDDDDVLRTAQIILRPYFSKVKIINRPDLILHVLEEEEYDVIILDMNYSHNFTSGKEGLFWLNKIRMEHPETLVLVNTAYGDVELAVQAMKDGATDFLVKPWSGTKLLATVKSVYHLSRSRKQIESLKNINKAISSDIDQKFPETISKAKSMAPVLEIVNKVSTTEATVLILGENGTGKELIARQIHRKSLRADGAFIHVDLGAIPETLFESELFGHVKGAFTDAKENRTGRFEMASGGTLFLDEIGNLPLTLQAKLLTSIQNKTITPVGSSKSISLDVRLICATNQSLQKMVTQNKFRQDLLYRINTVEINLPPLRNRPEDFPLLSEYFHNIFKKKYHKPRQKVKKEVYEEFRKYDWPGNVRELQHVIERATIMSEDDVLSPQSFLLTNRNLNEPVETSTTLRIENVEKKTIQKALKVYNGNVSKAASELGYGRSTIYRKMKKYGI